MSTRPDQRVRPEVILDALRNQQARPSSPCSPSGLGRDEPVKGCTPVFDVGITAGSSGVRLALAGELDLAGVGSLDRIVEVVHRAKLPLKIDCGDLTFIDAAGVGALLRACGRGATVEAVHGRVLRVLDLLEVTDRIGRRPFLGGDQRRAS